MAALQGRLDDRLHGRQAGAAGDGEDGAGLLLAQKTAAEGTIDADSFALLQPFRDVGAGAAVAGVSDVEFQEPLVRPAADRVVAWRQVSMTLAILRAYVARRGPVPLSLGGGGGSVGAG